MKRTIKITLLTIISILAFASCSKSGSSELNGRTYVYSNGETGRFEIYQRLEFKNNGNIYHVSKIGYAPEYNTDGCSLYYHLIDQELTIYHGHRGWKKEVRDTPYLIGHYDGNVIEIDGKIFKQR